MGAGVDIGSADQPNTTVDLGITSLLFTIGLKLRFSIISQRYIVLPTLLHMAAGGPLTAGAIVLAGMVHTPLAFDGLIVL